MAGAGQAVQQSLGTIDPSSLVGRADTDIVSPRSTAILIDAFRSGVVSADDIVSRIGQLGQSKKKAEIDMAGVQSMQAQEAMSPEAQAVRAQQLATQQAEGEQAQRTSEAAMLKQETLEKYPGVAYYDKLAVEAGIHSPPKLPDGNPDYAEMENIGLELALQKSSQLKALKELSTIQTTEDDKARVISSRYKDGGKPVDSNYVEKLRVTATKPIERMAPGTAQVAPVAAAPRVEARTAPVTGAVPKIVPQGAGWPMAPLPPEVAKPVAVDPVKRAQDMAAAQSQISQIAAAKAAITRGAAVGPLEGSAPVKAFNNVAAAFGVREGVYEDQRDLQIVLSQKVLEGAQLMKGNLSDKDIRFLEASVPKLKDTSNTWNTFLDRWDRMTKLNADILSGRTPPSVVDLFAPKDWEAGTGTAAVPASGGPPKVNSAAEVAALPATVPFFLTPDGRQKKNPNYRP